MPGPGRGRLEIVSRLKSCTPRDERDDNLHGGECQPRSEIERPEKRAISPRERLRSRGRLGESLFHELQDPHERGEGRRLSKISREEFPIGVKV